ncbi:MAG: ferritin [Ignavibacteriae bacterium HGW-Ignavibacteriae-2]|jgi:ferritin|nr:ferritin [Bacteroidota bacterium]PKL87806.1 MAG: ferritin [Ignavibacteriae bacterium HGW-Ignavibacteriae-2]
MLTSKMIDALNVQINKEFYSSYLYLAISAYFDEQNLNGMAGWMRVQSAEEYDHGMKFLDFIQATGGRVKLDKIDAPTFEWKSPQAAFENALEHEKYVTKSIHDLVDLALSEKDYATNNFLGWFVTEQVEEEQTASDIIEKFKLIGDNKNGLYMLDKELGARTASPGA